MSAPLAAVLMDSWLEPSAVFGGGPGQHAHAFWLDAGEHAETGWSWMGIATVERDVAGPRGVVCTPEADVPARGADVRTRDWGPFAGGWVGWLGYERGAASAGMSTASDTYDVPNELWLRTGSFVAFDHARRRVWAVAPAGEEQAFAHVVSRWAQHPIVVRAAPAAATAVARHHPGEYAALVERCRDRIRKGDAYQLCLTTRFDVTVNLDPCAVFDALRALTASHHGGLIRSAGVALASASPEQFLTAADGIVRTRPIKGTRPRGRDSAEDAALATELHASEKERAENIMIVDLMRNDLARVCDPATVAVDQLLAVESYPAVHQLVSSVTGRLREGTTVAELLNATFPAGSMTGAPKLSAMTILHEFERGARGVFAGCFGWVSTDGALDLAMVIRSVVIHPHGAYVGAGGGITWGSDAWAEVAEVALKARAPLQALGARLPPGW